VDVVASTGPTVPDEEEDDDREDDTCSDELPHP
jgi:hypothetical protein